LLRFTKSTVFIVKFFLAAMVLLPFSLNSAFASKADSLRKVLFRSAITHTVSDSPICKPGSIL
jgi:hypothetical protein